MQAGLRAGRRAACCPPGDELVAPVDLEPVLDVQDVGPDRRQGEAELLGDHDVLQTIGHEEGDLSLPRSGADASGQIPARYAEGRSGGERSSHLLLTLTRPEK
jgi:hypothetical protein